ncbi:unnamed protein product [Spirodela intermedia]|uniref:Uncharacterized protein n=1 Tax=Spirodela intermedia TaxID=51605 RepID=A0A7I8I9U9_SPIIN|nr:unnamed protein product [Spirodela intermedia]CAA6654298.1 unnamed protein product [Spirodela intermedia]
MLGLIVLLAIVLSLLLPSIPMAIFDAFADSVADVANDLAYKAARKFIEEFFERVKPWLVVLSFLFSYFSGVRATIIYDIGYNIQDYVFSDFGMLDTIRLLWHYTTLSSAMPIPRGLM